jgi:hypothetical protein
MKYVVVIALFGAMCLAEEARKPVCNARNLSQLWPEEANISKDTARQLYQSGELEMCTLVAWRYRWKHISVNVRDLGKGKHPLVSASKKTGPEESR